MVVAMSKGLKKLALVRSMVAIGHNFKRNPESQQAVKAMLPSWQRCYRGLVAGILTSSSLLSQCWLPKPGIAQPIESYCQFTKEAIAEKQNLLKGSLKDNADAQKRYKVLLKEHAEDLKKCRSQNWPRNQSVWLRLYPCDSRPGALDDILDRIVNQGYNQVNLEVFGDSQVLLPFSDNPTPWPSVVRAPGREKVDLLAQVIKKGHERGLRVYAWLFTMNFGYTYALRPDRESALARNGKGETTLYLDPEGTQAFIDPYSQQAKVDYYRLVQAVLQRKPDGILFDYIRYPRGTGTKSVATKVQDLWIYGNSARLAMYARAMNNKGRVLIQRFLSYGAISIGDIEAVDRLYPQEGPPLWQGRTPLPSEMQATAQARLPLLQWQLWQLSVAHAAQGILDFVNLAVKSANDKGVKAGTVFFAEANQGIGQVGYDSRLQPWDRFSSSIEWHPMVYGVCGKTICIENQVKRVLSKAPPGTQVTPALAGLWGRPWNNRPSLEAQMQAIHKSSPKINSISHFAFSWQNPDLDRDRKSCRLQ